MYPDATYGKKAPSATSPTARSNTEGSHGPSNWTATARTTKTPKSTHVVTRINTLARQRSSRIEGLRSVMDVTVPHYTFSGSELALRPETREPVAHAGDQDDDVVDAPRVRQNEPRSHPCAGLRPPRMIQRLAPESQDVGRQEQ